MKKLAARNYEDLLQVRNCFLSSKLITHSLYQCSIPVFEGLLPKKEDKVILKLLFELGTWHALAKLRIHTETTVTNLENSATRLSDLLRKFKSDVCSIYATKELPAEEAARGRLKAAKVLKSGGEAKRPAVKVENSGKKKKKRNSASLLWRRTSYMDYKTTRQLFAHLESQRTRAPRMYVSYYLFKMFFSYI
jgi:hypothetical protein